MARGMSDFVKSPELIIAVLAVAAILFFTLRAVAKGGHAACNGDGGGGLYPNDASTGPGDCGGDGGGGD